MAGSVVTTEQLPTGLNVRPGDADDGWETPPPVKLADGTEIQLYKDGEALLAAYEGIKAAKRRICLEVYIFADDLTGRAFAELLCKKAKEGLDVYVIYDSFGSAASDRNMFREMRRSGIKLRQFHPLRPWETRFSWRPLNRDHRKLLIIDDNIGGLGGLNIGKEYAGSWVIRDRDASECDCWRDNAISVRGPGASHLLHSFIHTWKYLGRAGPIRRAMYRYNIETLTKTPELDTLAIFASVPTRDSPLRKDLHHLFHQAQQSIQMTMAYFAPDDDLINTLCDAAKRGVKVQLMLPGRCDVKLLVIAARSFYEKLLLAGVEIYERQEVILHAKTMTVDGRTIVIGSTNLDYRSIEWNLELSAIVRSEELGSQMHELFKNDIRYAKQILEPEWKDRPFLDRVTQWIVSRARYLL